MSVLTLFSNSGTDMFSRSEMRAAYWSSPMYLPWGNRTAPVGPVWRNARTSSSVARMPSLFKQDLLLHQLLADLLHVEVENHRIVSVLRAALLQLLASNLLHLRLGHRVSR